jgi:type II secretory pathway predicted ATPase ExeA
MDVSKLLVDAKNEYRKLGWRKNPFTIQPNPDFIIDFEDEAKELIFSFTNGVHSLILGDLGTGKTTVLLWLKKALVNRAFCIYFQEPPKDLIKEIEVGLRKQGAFSFWDRFFPVKLTPEKIPKIKRPVVLLIDEVHKLEKEQQEMLKLLADKENVVIVLAGQNEAKKKFDHNKALENRLVTKINLKSLSPESITTLIKVRIQSVGGKDIAPFTTTAVQEISERSNGNPREALRLCNMVLNAVLAGEKLE